MFATVTRMPFIRGLAKYEVLLSSTTYKWVQILRNSSSGLKEIALHNRDMKEVPVEMTFSGFLQQKRDEARRSIVFQINSGHNWQALYHFCNCVGTVNKLYQYAANSAFFILVEMSSKEELRELVEKACADQNVIHHFALFDTRASKYSTILSQLNPLDIEKVKLNVKLKVKIDEVLRSTAHLKCSVSNKILDLSEELRLRDFCVRLRFLTCLQIECLLGGLMKNTTVYPFGSSVTGFGFKGCDLDLVVLEESLNFYEDQNPVMCFPTKHSDIDRRLMQSHLDVLSGLMEKFLVGCKGVNYIKHAKVPIIKFHHYFSSLECDLSIYITGGVVMTQLLYSLSSIDDRVRPLIAVVRVWAHKLSLTSKTPGPQISNFSLTLLVIFFLQQILDKTRMLPSLNSFPIKKNLLMTVSEELSVINNFKMTVKPSNLSLEELLLLFFKYYSSFDFSKHGVCIGTGKIVDNDSQHPLYIKNPLEPGVNISKNVNATHLLKFQVYVQCAKEILRSKEEITIGDVRKTLTPSKKPQYIPHKYLSMGELSQNTLRHLRWMLQKDLLKQDIFLIGRPGPARRQLAMLFLEMTGREMEYVSLSRDTTEADLKQRREILGGTAKYFDQNAVRAAVEGRVLVLEGIEKAERNVLPVLNNLLENREMHLEDGRFLIPASRYDKLLKDHSKEELDKWNLVRVSDEFRVIALGLPVPKYVGNPLDPPLRSRFQARNIPHSTFQEQLAILQEIAPQADKTKLSQLLSCAHALLSEESVSLGLPDFPVDNIPKLGYILRQFPSAEVSELFKRLYPYESFLNREGREGVRHVLDTFQVKEFQGSSNKLEEVKCMSQENVAQCTVSYNSSSVRTEVPCGSLISDDIVSKYIPTNYQENLIVELLQSHIVSDFCVIGPKGCGKSAAVLRLANMLNYEVEPIVLYQDITSRDLIQQRNTLPNGDTVWHNSPLIQAALEGKLAILDGIDRVHSSTLSVIHSLVQDRDVQLYDGKRLVRHDRYEEIKKEHNMSDDDMTASGILKVHPSFRIVALAESSKKGVAPNKWLSAEMLSLFLFHEMRPLSYQEESLIIQKLYGSTNEKIEKILSLAVSLRTSEDPTLISLSPFFSTRQLLRVAKRLSKYPDDSLYDTIQKACLGRFLPPITKEALDKAMKKEGITPETEVNENITYHVNDETLEIGTTKVNRYKTNSKSKVPDILFYNVPQHLVLLEWLVQDFTLGEHLLLVGNQGVGKNKIADRLLQLLNRPREYIQLHRDTTVQTLTLQPTVKEGVVSYEDSPLVQAVKNGHVLVVDEADKAPTHVTCILKTLVERGEMTLSDGRKIVPFGDARAKNPNIIEVHPDFRMIVLANRPGFPFLGNDFFGALGDLFSCHAVDNPSLKSELALLKQYGPDVPDNIILSLVKAFGQLRTMADKGLLQYPYSTREVVNIVKHLQNFPEEGLSSVVRNVFDFDKYSSSTLETVIPVLQRNGIPIDTNTKNVSLAKEYPLPKITKYGLWNINKISDISNSSVEIKNIKVSKKLKINSEKSEVDVTMRGAVFSEMRSYMSLPTPEGSVILGLAVTTDEYTSKDLINVLTINPFRLYVASEGTSQVKIFNLGSILPRIPQGSRYKFNMTRLSGNLSDNLLIHEENLNFLLIMNTTESSAYTLNLASATEKLMQVFGKPFVGKWKMNSQLVDDNIVILYPLRQGVIEVLDLNKMISYSMEVPLQIKSLQVVDNEKWLLQNIDNKKYLLVKKKPEDPIPSVFKHVSETVNSEANMGLITGISEMDLDDEILSKALDQKISSPNRLFLTDECYAALSVGFPDLDSSSNEVYCWFRSKKGWNGGLGKGIFLEKSSQIVTPVNESLVPKEDREQSGNAIGFLEVLDLKRRTLQYVPVPEGPKHSWYVDVSNLGIYLDKKSEDELVTVDLSGNIRFWEVGYMQLQRSLDDWKKLVGEEKGPLQLTIERDSGKDVSKPKHGKVDPKNDPHVGGNTWAGGTGGRDTAGLGGKGGPYRLDAGHDVHQISDAEKAQVPEEVKRAAREMGRRAFQQRLKEIRMSQYDHETYERYSIPVAQQVKLLKVVIENVQAKAKEREWVRHQTSGNLDDLKLIEGLTGEKTIYRRRTEKEPEPGAPQTKPKRLKLVADVSGSMYRFNGYDGRLDRMLEASVLVMEAFQDQETKFKYDITGHSGDGFNLSFVEADKPPKNNKDRLEVIKTMHAHSQFCMSGDHTLPATKYAIDSIAKEDCDEAIIIVLSDANFERYGIRPSSFAQILTSNPDVNAFAILIGSLGDEASRLVSTLPAGRAFVCMDLSNIPQIMQQIFTSSVLSST